MGINLIRSAPLTGGGTVSGDLTVEGDFVVEGDGSLTVDTVTSGNVSIVDTTSYSATEGGNLILGANNTSDGALDSGDRLGVLSFVGAEDSSSTLTTGARIEALADANWSASENGANLLFYTTDGNASQTEAMRIDASGRLLIGGTAGQATALGTGALEVQGTANSDTLFQIGRWSNNTSPGVLEFIKSRSGTIGTSTIVQDDDNLGSIVFSAADGVDHLNFSAKIEAEVDGAPGENDVPGRLVFFTTADGAGSATERMRIDSAGNVGIGHSAPPTLLSLQGDNEYISHHDGTNYAFKIGADSNGDGVAELYDNGSNLKIKFYAEANAVSYINNGGNFGIGTATPTQLLDISSSTGGILNLHREDTDITNNETLGVIYFSGRDSTSAGTSNPGAAILAQANSTWDTTTSVHDAGSRLKFYTQDDSGSDTLGTPRMTILGGGNVGIANTSPSGTFSLSSSMHIIALDQDIRFADGTDNTVIKKISDYKIPAKAIITRVVAVVTVDSDLATHEVNLFLNTADSIDVDTAIDSEGSETEILGAGVANTDSSDSTSASDISMGTSAGDEKEVWICNDQIINGAADQYIYVCNAGSGNGTTNSTAGTLSIIIEYYGID